MRKSNYISSPKSRTRHDRYMDLKSIKRNEAIEWQATVVENNYSIEELIEWNSYFEKQGKRYGLLVEFRENGIC